MPNLIIRAENTQLEIPSTDQVEITKGGLTLTLSFNGKGGFSLTQNGKAVASVPATRAQDPQLGTVMPDGTVYAGISPDTGKAFYAARSDEPEALAWDEALTRAASKDAHGRKDWRVPTSGELDVLFNNRAAIGGFNLSRSWPDGYYVSSSEYYSVYARLLNFTHGTPDYTKKNVRLSVRCVRG